MNEADVEYELLTTAAGVALLDEVAGLRAPRPADLARLRRSASEASVRAAFRLVEARRKGASKFARASAMWLDPVGVEQATAEHVAAHKALRFGSGLVFDLCGGIGGDAVAFARASDVVAVDLDHAMGRRVLWNARVHGVEGRVLAVRSRAEAVAIPRGALVHVDPDRRADPAQRRAQFLDGYQPGLDFLHALRSKTDGGAIKLGPASDFDAHFNDAGYEVEVVSLGGECKEATVWFGALANCRRRASILPAGATWTDRDAPPAAARVAHTPQTWMFDPDAALVRAGLLDAFAAAHSLARCGPGVPYLTGDAPLPTPFLSAFRVLDDLPFDFKTLRSYLKGADLSAREIKPRGVDVRPEDLRRRLGATGSHAVSLLIYAGVAGARAVVARRESVS